MATQSVQIINENKRITEKYTKLKQLFMSNIELG